MPVVVLRPLYRVTLRVSRARRARDLERKIRPGDRARSAPSSNSYLASPIVFVLKEQAQAKISFGLPLDDDALRDVVVQRLAAILPLVDPLAIADEIDVLKAAGHWRRILEEVRRPQPAGSNHV
jgi:hypothetical protein